MAGRSKSLIGNIVGNYLVKGIAMLLTLLMVPAYMNFFSTQSELGVWFTLSAVLNWILLFDFGIGGGVRNQIVEPMSKDDKQSVGEIITTAYISVGIIVAVMSIIAVLLVPKVNWQIIFGGDGCFSDAEYMGAVMLILILGIIFRLLSVLVSHIYYALQKAVVPNVIIVASNALILLYLLLCGIANRKADVMELAIVTSVANNAPALVATVIAYRKYFSWYRPKTSYFKNERLKSLLGVGGTILYLQIAIALLFNVKELLITWFAGSAQVVDYQIYYKLIGMVGGLSALALTPLWSAATKAVAERDFSWMKRMYRKSVLLILMVSSLQLILVPVMPILVHVWLGDNAIDVSTSASILFCVYNALYIWTMLHYNLCCGINEFRASCALFTIAAFLNVMLAYSLCMIVPAWEMVIIATIIALIPCAVALPLAYRKSMRAIIQRKELA